MADINLLLPKVKKMTEDFIAKCNAQGIKVMITSTYRSPEEQDRLYAQGRTTPGNVVTNAKGGQSIHNWRCAIDFAPVVNGVIPWNNKDLFTKIGQIGELCGFEWGGRWESFLDLPHLQYTAGYSLEDFQNGRVDYNKFSVAETLPEHYVKLMQAVKEFQLAEHITVFANETDMSKIRLGPATQSAIAKYQR